MDKYLVLKPLAQAIYGEILLGKECLSKNLVAMKQIYLASAVDHLPLESNCVVEEDAINELALNLQISKAGGHANICPLLDHVYSNDQTMLVLVFEYCPNADLLTSLQKVKIFGECQTKEFLHQVANAVHFLHQMNVAHRDISLENILLNKNGHCQLCDFGLATKDRTSWTAVGKLLYMAPEVFRNGEYASIPIDMWSLGVVLFTMLIGKYPFREANESDPRFTVFCRRGLTSLLRMHNATISATMFEILQRLLDINPFTRWTSAQLIEFLSSSKELSLRDILHVKPIIMRPNSTPKASNPTPANFSTLMAIRPPQVVHHRPVQPPATSSIRKLFNKFWPLSNIFRSKRK